MNNTHTSSDRTGAIGGACLLIAAACWGGTYVTSKYALAYVGPFTLVAARYILASLVFVPIYLARDRMHVPASYFPRLALTSFIGLTVSSWTQFEGTALSTAHAGALITSSAPAFMVLFAAVILKERITSRKLLALSVASLGVITVIGPGDVGAGRMAIIGDLLLVAAGLTWALYSVLIRRLTTQMSTGAVTTYVALFGAGFGIPLALPEAPHLTTISPAVALNILYVGLISTGLAYYLWNKGLELVEASSASVFFFAQPLTGTFFAWLFLGEKLSVGFFVGGALILLGVAIASR